MLGTEWTQPFSERVTASRGMWDMQPWTEGPSGWDLTLLFIEPQPRASDASSLLVFANFVRWCYCYPHLQ